MTKRRGHDLSVQGTFLNEIPDRSRRAFLCVPALSARSSNIGLGAPVGVWSWKLELGAAVEVKVGATKSTALLGRRRHEMSACSSGHCG